VFAFGIAMVIGADELRAAFFSSTGRDASLSGRDQLWERVLEEADDAPLLGTGFGAFWYQDRGRELVLTWNPKQAHNSWIDVLVEIGWTGLFAFIVLVPLRLLSFWQRCAGRRGTRRRDAAAAIFASTVVLVALAARSESFFLRMDKLQWFVTVWGLLPAREPRSQRVRRRVRAGRSRAPGPRLTPHRRRSRRRCESGRARGHGEVVGPGGLQLEGRRRRERRHAQARGVEELARCTETATPGRVAAGLHVRDPGEVLVVAPAVQLVAEDRVAGAPRDARGAGACGR
jgi:hypothetical protein